VRLLHNSKRRDTIEAAAEQLNAYARIAVERRRRGTRMSALDAQIAGIVRAAGGSLATRNVTDFTGCGIDLIDPWATR